MPERALFRIPLAVEIVLGAIGIFVFCATVYAGLVGTDTQSENLAPTAVYVGFWVGIPFASLAARRRLPAAQPVAGDRAARSAGSPHARPARCRSRCPYPERLGNWPAVAGIFGFVICELCWATGREPTPIGVLMLIYARRPVHRDEPLRRRAVVAQG